MKPRLLMLRNILFVSLIAAGCTATQIDAFEQASGIKFDTATRELLLNLPEEPLVAVGEPPAPPASADPVDRWHDLALQSGWDEARWPWLRCVIARESRGNPDAFNGSGPDRSYGLMQINAKAWSSKMRAFASTEAAFFDPGINLRFALWLYDVSGPQNWSTNRNC